MAKTAHRVWKYGDNVNTDVIFPGKYTYTVSRDPAALARHALEDLDPHFAGAARPGRCDRGRTQLGQWQQP